MIAHAPLNSLIAWSGSAATRCPTRRGVRRSASDRCAPGRLVGTGEPRSLARLILVSIAYRQHSDPQSSQGLHATHLIASYSPHGFKPRVPQSLLHSCEGIAECSGDLQAELEEFVDSRWDQPPFGCSRPALCVREAEQLDSPRTELRRRQLSDLSAVPPLSTGE